MLSPLQNVRQAFSPPLPSVLRGHCSIDPGAVLQPPSDAGALPPPTLLSLLSLPLLPSTSLPPLCADAIAKLFPSTFGAPTLHLRACPPPPQSAAPPPPLRIGAVLSGGQAPGGHNVLSGIYDGIKRAHPDSVLFGFLDGPRGLFRGDYVELDEATMARYRNMGGFDAIGSGRDKIETPEQFAGARAVAERLRLDGVVIIGGDDSNTNAAVLAEYFKANGCATRVVGAPKVRCERPPNCCRSRHGKL